MEVLIGLIEHIGDIVACEPVARYLQEKYPGAHLSWAVREPYRELIDVNPHIDETITLGCLTDWIRLYKHAKYDLIVDLHVNNRVCEHCRVPLIKEHGNPFVNAWEWFDYDSVNRVGSVTGSFSGKQKTYVNNFSYAPQGAPAQYAYGNTLWRQLSYNNRLQMSGYIDLK